MYKVISVPGGPESNVIPKTLFQGSREECLKFYEDIRQRGRPDPEAVVVTNDHDEPVYACSY
jgi:hypothetical protein